MLLTNFYQTKNEDSENSNVLQIRVYPEFRTIQTLDAIFSYSQL